MRRLTIADIIVSAAPIPCAVLASAAVSIGVIGIFADVPACRVLALVGLGFAVAPFVLALLLGWRP